MRALIRCVGCYYESDGLFMKDRNAIRNRTHKVLVRDRQTYNYHYYYHVVPAVSCRLVVAPRSYLGTIARSLAQRPFSDHDEAGRVAQRDLCDRSRF